MQQSHVNASARRGAAVVVRNLPGLLALEDQFLFCGNTAGTKADARAWAEKTFQVIHHEAQLGFPAGRGPIIRDWLPPGYLIEPEYVQSGSGRTAQRTYSEDEIKGHQARLETLSAGDIETVGILVRLKLDFRGENGQPLRCTLAARLQAECAARGLFGTMPEPKVIGAKRFEESLSKDRIGDPAGGAIINKLYQDSGVLSSRDRRPGGLGVLLIIVVCLPGLPRLEISP